MSYDPAIHHRRSIRLSGHDYAGGGTYFVTLCAAKAAGRVFDPPPVRALLARVWQALPGRFTTMDPESPYAIMPDHFHGLIRLRPGSASLGDIICSFKSLADREYRLSVRAGLVSALPKAADARTAPTGKIWQRNYYERIIRSERDLQNTIQYIRLNPARLILNLPPAVLPQAGLVSAPAPVISAFGNPALLDMPKMGMLASGTEPLPAPPPLPADWALLTGGHSGQEQQALEQTLASGSHAILMPVVAPEAVALSPGQLTALCDGRLLVICPFAEPHTTRENALNRNRAIAEWSDALWIPAMRLGGSLQVLSREYAHKCLDHNLKQKENHERKNATC